MVFGKGRGLLLLLSSLSMVMKEIIFGDHNIGAGEMMIR